MKKLMTIGSMAAAIALGSAAYAGSCNDTVDCAFAYTVKVILRTTAAKTTNPTTQCEEKQCYRTTGRLRLIGYVYGTADKTTTAAGCGCGETNTCGCNEWKNAKLKLWNYDTHEAVIAEDVKLLVLDRIMSNGKNSVAEIALSIDSLTFGGFGNCSVRSDGTMALKNATGFCAGTLAGPVCTNCKECGDIVPASAWSICSTERNVLDVTPVKTAAYGKWIMRWDSGAVTALTAGKTLQPANYDAAEEFDIVFDD